MSLPAVILAGGRAARMGGGDKGLMPLGEGVVLDSVLGRLRPQTIRIALNANGDAARFDRFGLEVLPDTHDDAGPLAGVLVALRWAAGLGAERVLTVAGDTPFLPHHLAVGLRSGAVSGGARVVLAETGEPDEGRRLHPTCALWQTGLADELEAALVAGTRKMGLWAEEQGAHRVRFHRKPGAVDPFFNINTPEDLAAAQALL